VVEDRRVRRTRRLLRKALLSLILERGYDHVTVQDVLDRADVGRATFYAHFRDKDDLLVSGADELRASLRQQVSKFVAADGSPNQERLEVIRVLFEHAALHRRLYHAMLGRRGAGTILKYAHQDLTALFREHLEEVIAHRGLRPTVPVDIVAHYVVSSLLALLTWWLDNDLPYTAHEMSQVFQKLTRSGVAGALGTKL
jgi:AcrR family transcriptional regulator